MSSARPVTADFQKPARDVSTAAVAPARHQEMVGAQVHLDTRLASAVATVSTRDVEAASVLTIVRVTE